MGVAETQQEKDEKTVKQRNIEETADEFRTKCVHFTSATFSFTLDVFGCYKNTTCLALRVQSSYTFTYKHSHSKAWHQTYCERIERPSN